MTRTARLIDAGNGVQILISEANRQLLGGRLPSGLSLVDEGEHRLKDLGELIQIYRLVSSADRDQRELRTLERAPHNLPIQSSTFVGREGHIKEVADLVRHARLVTLTGIGGVGKTLLSAGGSRNIGQLRRRCLVRRTRSPRRSRAPDLGRVNAEPIPPNTQVVRILTTGCPWSSPGISGWHLVARWSHPPNETPAAARHRPSARHRGALSWWRRSLVEPDLLVFAMSPKIPRQFALGARPSSWILVLPT